MGYRGHMVTVLEVDWDRLNADGLWTEAEIGNIYKIPYSKKYPEEFSGTFCSL